MRTSVGGCMLGVLLTLLCSTDTAEAQSVSGDLGSQRILPLPQGKLSDVQTQMQLLQKLRSIVAAPEDSPKIDDKQLEQLQQALNKLQEQLPPGVMPPDLNSIPKEQLDEAMANPAMQQNLKKLLEQFSKDGLLPKNDSDTSNSPLPPVPRRRGQSPTQPQEQASPPTKPADQSWELLKDAMKKLSEIAQGKKNKSPQNEDGSPRVDASEDGADALPRTSPKRGGGDERQPRTEQPRTEQPDTEQPDTEQPDTEQPRTEQPDTDRNEADLNEVERGAGDPGDEEAGNRETQQPSLQAFQDLLERFKDSQRKQQPSDDGTDSPDPDETRLPEVRPGMRSPRSEDNGSAPAPDALKRVNRRPDRATPVEPPVRFGPRTSEQGEVFPPAEMPSGRNPQSPPADRDGLDQSAERQGQKSSGNGSSEKSMPSVSEFLQEQLRRGFPAPGAKEGTPDSKTSGSNARPQSSMPRDSGGNDSEPTGSPDASPETNQSKIDIQRELQKRGLRGTLDQLIQNAREETKARQFAEKQAEQQSKLDSLAGQTDRNEGSSGKNPMQPENTASPSGRNGTPGDAGLQKSLTDLLSGMDDQMEELINGAKFKERSGESRRPRDSSRQQSHTDSSTHTWSDAASNFLSDLSKAPPAPTSPRASSGGGTSVSGDTQLPLESFLMIGLGLLGMVAVAVFVMRRPLLQLVSVATGVADSQRVYQPSDIRSREDVISAFHALALNPHKLVESWWTHRAAATQLAAESPQQGSAVQTLAEIYEQARYLPDDVELPAAKIQSARTALAECR